MNLAFKQFGHGQPMVILHGLFGSSDNWQTLGKQFAADFEVYLVDQRNHGRSPHSDEFSYDIMAEDLADFFEAHDIQHAIVIGHSMGGKVAMRFAQEYPEYVNKLVVVDMGVKGYAPHHQDVIAAFESVDVENLKSRKDAETSMMSYVPDFGTRQFILKNLYRKTPDSFAWRANVPVLKEKLAAILEPLPYDEVEIPTLFLYGSKSNYVITEDYGDITRIFKEVEFAALPTGHWIHAEDPEGFYREVKKFVTK